jgi:hypothetical protein
VPGRFISVKETIRKICLSKTELYDRLRGLSRSRSLLDPERSCFLNPTLTHGCKREWRNATSPSHFADRVR